MRGLTQPQLASIVGVALRSYQNYEQGTRKPCFDTLIALSQSLNVTTDYLLGLSDEVPSDE